MTIKQILVKTKEELEQAGILNSQLEAELIISHVEKVKREKILSQIEKRINSNSIKKIERMCQKRISGQPMAYLLGYKNFYQLEFAVNKHTLIPRPESELIIEQIISKISPEQKNLIIDIGTGSGCLIISLANILKNDTTTHFWATDVSRSALKIAKKNAKKHQLKKKIIFSRGNLLKPFIKKIKSFNKKNGFINIIIIANLPYLTKKEIKESPSIKFEPRQALYGGKDGLKYYKKLLEQIKKIKNEYNSIELYQEISNWQKEKLEKIIIKKIGRYNPEIETILDLAGKNRLIKSNF